MGELKVHPSVAARAEKKLPSPICAADVEPKDIRWLWQPYIPRGMVTMLEGDPGLGKSWITLKIAADVSMGRALPGMPKGHVPMSVLMGNTEDPIAESIIPRLLTLRADLSKIFFLPELIQFDPQGFEHLELYMANTAATILFLDPIQAFLGSGVDMHRANEVRPLMAKLGRLAERTDSAVITVRHLRKPGADSKGNALYRGLGSIDFTAAVRSVLQVDAEDGATVMRHIKHNLSPKGPSIAYKLDKDTPEEPFHWGGVYNEEPSGVCRRPKATDIAREFIAAALNDGPLDANDIFTRASAEGISKSSLMRAKLEMGVKSTKSKEGWTWELV